MHPIKSELDKISNSFCAAKWLQVTIRLQNGQTHSCHHPATHKVPLVEIKKNPSALHNTEFKKAVRAQMLEGKKPSECSYCWKVEALNDGQEISDRFYKSADDWASPYLEELKGLPWDADVAPKYVELSFSNVCNFKCAYCFPDISSKWMSEVLEYGPYPTSEHNGSLVYLKKTQRVPIEAESNPYIKAFWQWLPQIAEGLHVLRLTGGEPLLSKDCQKVIEFLAKNSNSKLSFCINTNLGVPSGLVTETLSKLKILLSEKRIKEAQIYTSLDCWGPQVEYIRFGLDLELWKKNLDLCLKVQPALKTVIIVTYNVLSPFSFLDFLKFVLAKKQECEGRLEIDISILHFPKFLCINVLPERHLSMMEESLKFMHQNAAENGLHGFYKAEVEKMQRLIEFAKVSAKISMSPDDLRARRDDFVAFFQEYDRRKKTNLSETFPEFSADFVSWQQDFSSRGAAKKASEWVLAQGQKYVGRLLV